MAQNKNGSGKPRRHNAQWRVVSAPSVQQKLAAEYLLTDSPPTDGMAVSRAARRTNTNPSASDNPHFISASLQQNTYPFGIGKGRRTTGTNVSVCAK
jgi:hypothetical protein